MHPEAPHPTSNEPGRGLPPVAPPSSRFLAQLFLIPGLIVAVAVFIVLGSSYLVRSGHTPEQFLQNLDSPNPEIRWRGAHDLAQVLKRPESVALASDPKFALDLAERLEAALAELEKAEWAVKEQVEKAEAAARERRSKLTDAERDAMWRKLSQQRNHVLYLISALGDFTVPVGAPLLGELALRDEAAEVKGVTLRRRRAVWALANLGDNFKRRYQGIEPRPEDKALKPEERAAAEAALEKEIQAGKGRRAEWARQALVYVRKEAPAGFTRYQDMVSMVLASAPSGPLTVAGPAQLRPPGVDTVLERAAGADDPYLRSLVAHALNFWDGDRVEPTLLRLARDDGRGTRVEITETD